MGFVNDLVKDGLSSAVHRYFENDKSSGEAQSRIVAAERTKILNSGPVMTSRGLFHKTKQHSVEGAQGWKIEVMPDCASPTTKFDQGASHVYKTVQEAQTANSKPCPHCYENHPRNLLGQL